MHPGSLTWEMCPHTKAVSCPQYKTHTLILHQGSPVEYVFYSLLLSYTGSCVLVSESLKLVPLGAAFQAVPVHLAQLFAIPINQHLFL